MTTGTAGKSRRESVGVRTCTRSKSRGVGVATLRNDESHDKREGSGAERPEETVRNLRTRRRITGFNVLQSRRRGTKRKMAEFESADVEDNETEEQPICNMPENASAAQGRTRGEVRRHTNGRQMQHGKVIASSSAVPTEMIEDGENRSEGRYEGRIQADLNGRKRSKGSKEVRNVVKSTAQRVSDRQRTEVLRRRSSRLKDLEALRDISDSDSGESIPSSSDDSFVANLPDPDSAETFATTQGASESTSNGKRVYRYIKRKEGKVRESDLGKIRAGEIAETASLYFSKWKCCRRLKCFAQVDLIYFRSQREKLLKASQIERKQALTSMLREDGKFHFNLRTVCATFLELGFRFSRDLQSSVKGTPLAPAPQRSSRGRSANISCYQRHLIISFLKDLAEVTADEMPNSKERHLPYHQKNDVYELLKEMFKLRETSTTDRVPPTLAYFVRTWNTYVPHIKVRKIRPFSKCQTCEEARQALADAKGDKEKCAPIMARQKEHLRVVTLERAAYLSRATRAIQEPEKCWSIAIDGADQSRFGLPHFVVSTTKQTRGHAIKVKVVGLLQHASECSCFLYTMTGQFETGANHVIEVIHRWMLRKQRFGNFPDTLYVQTDNTTRENKNRYLMGYLECLVAWGVFKEIQISFLPVGHTHIDIDQRFSCTSRKLKTSNALSMQELHEQLRKSMTPRPSTTALDHVANISGLFESSASLRSPPPFSRYRFFRFMRVAGRPSTGTGRFNTTCKVKMSCDDEWGRLFDAQPNWGFLLSAPDLRNTPETILRAPDDKEKVFKRIESEYSRINDESKRESLIELMRRIYQDRPDKFHWNVLESAEMNGRHHYGVRSRPAIVSENDLRTYEPRTRVHYDINSFVAIKPEVITKECPFWIAQVLGNVRNIHGVVAGINILWYEVEAGKNVYEGMYTVSQVKLRNGRWKEWDASVSTDAVFYNFARLTRRGRLSSDDARRIEEEVEKRWLGENQNSADDVGIE